MTNSVHLSAGSLLTSYNCADEREEAYRLRCLTLLQADAPFARDQFTPGHFTASAFVLSPDQRSVLMIYHSKLKRWLQPGGHIDATDGDVHLAAQRELIEETGLQRGNVTRLTSGLFDIDIHLIPANSKKMEASHEHFDLRVLFGSDCWELAASSDALDAKWVKLEDFEQLDTDHSVRRVVDKIRGRIAHK